MNNRYMRELRRQMRCSRKTQNRLLEQFTAYQLNSLDETPDYEQMVTMFGPPDEMAQTLMEEITPSEESAFRRSRLQRIAIGIIAGALWVLFTGYVYWMKTVPIEHNRIIVETQTLDTSSTEAIE